jgi:hypothetical protein
MEAIGGKTREEKNWIIDSKNFPIIYIFGTSIPGTCYSLVIHDQG